MSKKEFLSLTPKEFTELEALWAKEHRIMQELEDRRVARICAVFVNCNRDPKKPAVSEDQFMPRRRPPIESPSTISSKFHALAKKFHFKLIKDA